MFGVSGCLFDQADALADVITNRLGLQVTSGEWRALLLGDALARREAHPLLLASLGHELARRAGLQSVVARSHDDFCCVLIAGEMALPVCFGEAPDGLDVSALRSCCAHELAFTILAAIGGHAPAAAGGRGRPRPRGDADRLGPDRLVAARRSLRSGAEELDQQPRDELGLVVGDPMAGASGSARPAPAFGTSAACGSPARRRDDGRARPRSRASAPSPGRAVPTHASVAHGSWPGSSRASPSPPPVVTRPRRNGRCRRARTPRRGHRAQAAGAAPRSAAAPAAAPAAMAAESPGCTTICAAAARSAAPRASAVDAAC